MEDIFEAERKYRLDGNMEKLHDIHAQIIDRCSSDEEIISTLKSLSNKRGQDHNSIKLIVKKIFDMKKSIQFYELLLSEIIEAKIYLESERIYISNYIKDVHGDNIEAGYKAIKDVPVETFTTLEESDRNRFIFEQFRLALLLNYYGDAELIAKKVRKGCMNENESVIFYKYIIMLKIGKKAYLEAAKIYLEFSSLNLSNANIALGSFYCMLSSCLVEKKHIVEEKMSMLTKFAENETNDLVMRTFVVNFKSDTIIQFNIIDGILDVFKNLKDCDIDDDLYKMYIEEFKIAIIEHNIFMIKKFVSKIKIDQLALILGLTIDEAIDFISLIVNEKFVDIKINQINGIVDFGDKKSDGKLVDVLNKLVNATHLIHQDGFADN